MATPRRSAGALEARVATLERQTRELSALYAVSKAVSQIADLDELLENALDAVLSAVAIPELRPVGAIFLVDQATGRMRLAAQRGLGAEGGGPCPTPGACLCGIVVASGQTTVSPNGARDRRYTGRCSRGPQGHIVAPLHARGRTVGVLSLYLEPDVRPDPAYVELVTAIGQQLGLAVEQAQLYQRLQHTVGQLQTTNALLDRTNSELRVSYELAMAMQSSADLSDVQERLLSLITQDLGYGRAILAMVDRHAGALSGWLCSTRGPGGHLQRIPHTTRLPLDRGEGPLVEALRSGEPLVVCDGRPPTGDPQVNAWLGLESYLILPMAMRQQVLGVLIVDAPESERRMRDEDLTLLANVGRQASVVLGGVQICIDQAQHLAVEEERSRIAMEVHDSIAQQLYGLTYTIDACLDLLPEHPLQVREQLAQLMPHARQANLTIRRAIFDLWPDELDHERFAVELRGYLESIAPAAPLDLRIEVEHGYDALPPHARRQLYRIAQEALNNVVKHAGARAASLSLLADGAGVRLRLADDGRGFDAAAGLPERPGHYGLASMCERAEAIGGSLAVESAPGRGTVISVTVPLRC